MTSTLEQSETQSAKPEVRDKPSFGVESLEPRVLLCPTLNQLLGGDIEQIDAIADAADDIDFGDADLAGFGVRLALREANNQGPEVDLGDFANDFDFLDTVDTHRSIASYDAVGSQDSDIPLFITTCGAAGRVVIRNVPEGAEFSHGSIDGEGVLSVDQSELESLCIRPPSGFVGDFNLEVQLEGANGQVIANDIVNVWVNGGIEGTPVLDQGYGENGEAKAYTRGEGTLSAASIPGNTGDA